MLRFRAATVFSPPMGSDKEKGEEEEEGNFEEDCVAV
jgi:hypothetical protein